MTKNSVTQEVAQVGAINFGPGNLIPNTWYKHLKLDSGKVNLPAVTILSEIVWWYRPKVERDEATGLNSGNYRKFKGDKLQMTYAKLGEKFGLTKKQCGDACRWLQKKGLITLESRTVLTQEGLTIPHVLFIGVVPEKIAAISEVSVTVGFGSVSVPVCTNPQPTSTNLLPVSTTNTEITTEITTDIIFGQTDLFSSGEQPSVGKKVGSTVDEQFEEFWAIAIRKVAKGGAKKSFKTALKSVDFSTLMTRWEAANKKFAKQAEESGTKEFIKHPTTWLNQNCWEDEDLIQRAEQASLEKHGSASAQATDTEYIDENGYIIVREHGQLGWRTPDDPKSVTNWGYPPNRPYVKHVAVRCPEHLRKTWLDKE